MILTKLIIKLVDNISSINKYVIKLKKGKQIFNQLFYSLRLAEPKTLKIYIKTNLKTGFILFFKFLTSIFIYFN